MMNSQIEKIRKIRAFLLNQIANLTPEQLNKIPEGFNNNIIWNLGHLIGSQQSICYLRAGQPITVKDEYFTPFLTNTKPERFIDHAEIEEIKSLFVRSIDTLQTQLPRISYEFMA